MSKAAFAIEKKRATLAAQKKLTELRKLYTAKHPEIKDLNSALFWNNKLVSRKPLKDQDGMTRDRVRVAANFFLEQNLQSPSILDIGMGDGWVEELLENKNVKLYGNDISDRSIKNIKKRFKGNFSVQSIYKLTYKKRFDAIFLLEVLEHIPPKKTFTVLHAIYSLLVPKGFFILSVPTNEGLDYMKDNPSGHVRMYTVPLITAELEIAGFKVIKCKTLSAFQNFYPLKKFISKLFPNHWKPNDIIILAQK